MIDAGVLAGAKNAVHTGTSMSGTPASAIVGRLGHEGWRCADVMAMPRTVPALSGPVTGGGSTNVTIASPAMSACTDSPLLLYGIMTKLVAVFCLKSSVVSWKMPALDE